MAGGTLAKGDAVEENLPESDRKGASQSSGGGSVAEFDYSVENLFAWVDAVAELCGIPQEEEFDANEIRRFSSAVTFLKEWKSFYYEPKYVNFTYKQAEDLPKEVKLPHFSAASVPKIVELPEVKKQCNSTDFILHAGGLVWALDWCPDNHRNQDSKIKCEYLAVAAHPPNSAYHKLGAPSIGRGVIQIWCLLNLNEDVEIPIERPRNKGRPRKNHVEQKPDADNTGVSATPKPRGRFRKYPAKEKQTISRPRGRLRKRPASSSDEETLTISSGDSASSFRKPRGRPRKHLLPVIIDVNEDTPAPDNTSITSTLDKHSAKKSLATISSGQSAPSSRKPRGRPRKHPLPAIIDVDDQETPLLNNNDIPGTGDNVVPLCVDFGKDSVDLPISSSIECQDQLIQRRLTERQKTNPVHSTHSSVTSSLVSGNDGVILPSDSVPSVSSESQNKSKEESNQSRSGVRTRKEASLKMDASEPVPIDVLKKDSKEMHEPINKGQKKIESSPFNAKERTEDKKENTERRDCENPKSCNDHRMTADNMPTHENQSDHLVVDSSESVDKSTSQAESDGPIPQYLAFPRVVFCLAHNGKVAWDVKWRPATSDAACKERMGYLGVLLGSGSLEVWEVPILGMTKTLFKSSHHKDTDPRFLKLTPVFRCSKVKRGDKQSIPLTMEWSPSFPHDLILAGCHDGTVILWKFSPTCSSEDTWPLLCCTADSTPIRSLAWAPNASDFENNNLFVTAGNEGIKFWDLRDPYRALWEIKPVDREVLSVDWVNDTRCVVMTLDDGTMKILSLSNSASDVPVTGKPFVGSKYHGLHSFPCSPFAIWSIHVSRTTGFAAYCCEDGSTIRFQLTTKSVDKDQRRNRMPHFLCGSLLTEGGTLKIHTPLSNAPRWPSLKKEKKVGALPPKIVALHSVRWNTNKGSERWLCYGGAAGVVRCQRINFS